MKFWILIALVLAGCVGLSLQQPVQPEDVGGQTDQTSGGAAATELDDLGAAPEWQNETWLNTDKPLRLMELRGNVILLDMWTFG